MMNEPHRGYIDLKSLHEFDYNTDLHLGVVREWCLFSCRFLSFFRGGFFFLFWECCFGVFSGLFISAAFDPIRSPSLGLVCSRACGNTRCGSALDAHTRWAGLGWAGYPIRDGLTRRAYDFSQFWALVVRGVLELRTHDSILACARVSGPFLVASVRARDCLPRCSSNFTFCLVKE
jgi:hypothetical protein